ncbi:GNAT family N-acetyltransferase [Flavobacterium caeni]|uniref:Putative acetyltransferase n=1 Tax=Flavobacterium caeni TaxID=490189 RepID=A0A1G5FEL3_9FLAO|nr:GNAT family N-acetyltransferase [Flavobacterium caeni]SCY37695.1 putative acetyltransferase [Flavobacterium caeni]
MPVPFAIVPYEDRFKKELVDVWERSVRATHDFLDPTDIVYFKGIVEHIDFNSFPVFCVVDQNRVVGFVGVADTKIEMLFLDPDHIGKGLGKRLVEFALVEWQANKVDVNEQNLKAVKFYEKCGFVVCGRTEKDSAGKDYPILQMKI